MSKVRRHCMALGLLLVVATPTQLFETEVWAQDEQTRSGNASSLATKALPIKENVAKGQKAPAGSDKGTGLTADDIIDRASAALDAARMMTADFVQLGPDGERTEGELYVLRPGRLLFRYNPPSKLEIVADGRSVAIRDRKLGTQDLYFIQQTPLKFLLADHIDLRRDVSIKRVDTNEKAPSIEIEDKQTFGGKSDITLIFDPETFALKQWIIIDSQGFQTVVTLFDVDLVSKPDLSQFFIDTSVPANAGPGKR